MLCYIKIREESETNHTYNSMADFCYVHTDLVCDLHFLICLRNNVKLSLASVPGHDMRNAKFKHLASTVIDEHYLFDFYA